MRATRRRAYVVGVIGMLVAPVVATGAVGASTPASAAAATFTVNSTADAAIGVPANCGPQPAPATCRLRDAVAAASATPGDSVIVLAVAGPVALTAGELSYASASGTLTISGNGVVVSQPAGRVVRTTGDLTIDHATLVAGDDAVTVEPGRGAKISVVASTITAGGTAVDAGSGSATVADSTLTASAGHGVVAESGVAVTRSTVRAPAGTAVQARGAVQLNASTIAGSGGDGVATVTDAVVVNSTITDNRGCGVSATGAVTLVYATVTANGGGSCGANVRAASLTSFGSVVALVTAPVVNCRVDHTATKGYNRDSDTTCGFLAVGDQSGAGDPQLGPLGDHGGATAARLPSPDSPLQDKIPAGECGGPGGPVAPVTTDQRGVARPQGGACDIGAVELDQQGVHATAGVPVYSSIPTADRVVFFTIDDGIVKDQAALDFIRARQIPVTMFPNPAQVRQNPGYFQAIHALGASVQDHTVSHPDLTTLSYADQQAQICGPLDEFQSLFGQRPWLLRPPYGSYNGTTSLAAAACGIQAMVLWRATMTNGVLTTQGGPLRPGDIVLMHFTSDLRLNLEVALNAALAQGLRPAPLEAYLPGGGSTPGTQPGSKPAIYRRSAAQLFFRNSRTSGVADSAFLAGAPGDVALWCDWNNDGAASWGVYRWTSARFFLSNENFTGARTFTEFRYGNGGDTSTGGDIPICGSWFGGGATVGLYRPSNATFYLRTGNDAGSEQTVAIQYGALGDRPVVGRWSGSAGRTTIGVFRPGSGAFFLRNSNTPGFADHVVVFGAGTDTPIVGDWDASGTDTPAVTRPGLGMHWYFTNATDGYAPTSGDFFYGDYSDEPVVWR